MTALTFLPAWHDPDDHGPFDTEARFELDLDNFCDFSVPEGLRRKFLDMVPWEAFWEVWQEALKELLDRYLQEKTDGECSLAFSFDGTWVAQVSPAAQAAVARRLGMSEEEMLELRENDSIRFNEMLCDAYELTADHIRDDLVANWSLPDPFYVLRHIAGAYAARARAAREYRRRGQHMIADYLQERAAQSAQAKLALRFAEKLKGRYTDVTPDTRST